MTRETFEAELLASYPEIESALRAEHDCWARPFAGLLEVAVAPTPVTTERWIA